MLNFFLSSNVMPLNRCLFFPTAFFRPNFPPLKGQCREVFSAGFYHESVSPQTQSIPTGPFQIFLKIPKIFASQGGGKIAAGNNDTRGN
jgi:hypothetical protein